METQIISSRNSQAAATMPLPSLTYTLFLHHEELRKRRCSSMRISRTKFQLTHELITKTIKNIHKCSANDLQALSRETIFKKNLRRQIARMRHMQHMQMLKYQQEQERKFNQQCQMIEQGQLQQEQQQQHEQQSMVLHKNDTEQQMEH